MIVLGQAQHLGQKSLFLTLSRKTTLALVLFIFSGALVFLAPSLALGIAGAASFGGSIDGGAAATIYNGIVSLGVFLFLGSIILFLATLIIVLMRYRNFVFILEEFSLKMRKGILNKEEVAIPYRQIQDINLVRTLFHRLFGVSRLIMITAGHEDAKEHDQTDTVFDPIDADIAEEVRTFLERRIGVQVVQSAAEADIAEDRERSSQSHA